MKFCNITCKWSITPTHIRKAIMHADPKSVKRQSSHEYLFSLLGSTLVKAAGKMLVKLTTEWIKMKRENIFFIVN